MVSERVATTPLAMAVLFMPTKRQVIEPGALSQDTDLPAADPAVPTAMAAEEKSLVE